ERLGGLAGRGRGLSRVRRLRRMAVSGCWFSRDATANEGLDADGRRVDRQREPGLLVASAQGHRVTEPPRRRLASSSCLEHLGCRDHPLWAELGEIAETRCLI